MTKLDEAAVWARVTPTPHGPEPPKDRPQNARPIGPEPPKDRPQNTGPHSPEPPKDRPQNARPIGPEPPKDRPPKTAPIGPELLEEIRRMRETAAAYAQLSRRLRGEAQRQVRGIYQSCQRQVRTLCGVYRFLTGDRPPAPPPAKPGRQGTIPEVLRWLMRQMELSAGRLEALAARSTGEARAALLEVSRRDRALFQELLWVLGQQE